MKTPQIRHYLYKYTIFVLILQWGFEKRQRIYTGKIRICVSIINILYRFIRGNFCYDKRFAGWLPPKSLLGVCFL